MQVKYVMYRSWLRIKEDPSITIFPIFGQLIMALILSSVLYNLPQNTDSSYFKGADMFFAVLYNAFASLLEIMSLFEARAIVEKHKKYALYRPSADALASIVSELPVKLMMSMSFNFVFYFMSHLFRSIGAVSTSLAGAMTPATTLLLAMVIYTGFVIPTPLMLGWSRWINYINPVGYVFESLMLNEVHDREFECTSFIPSGPNFKQFSIANKVCQAVGARPGRSFVNGTDYLQEAYRYTNGHKWRNLGITIAFAVFFLGVYVALTEFNKGAMQNGEIILFLKGSLKKHMQQKAHDSEYGGIPNEKISYEAATEAEKFEKGGESGSVSSAPIPENKEIFFWRDLTYQVKIKKEDRVILNHVDGWVKPGQITALMGASGAGRTTLLNCLSERVTSGTITDGVRLVNGHALDSSFQRSIGHVQQQDLHLPTSTVREALQFSAYLRQPRQVSKKEKDDYVDYVIDLLDDTLCRCISRCCW
ncbi:hypothetical protein KGF54_001091 [Candida jiufengensis]|uniref:uncharacterized protein n=1 Tax=Candida jiufengensis TaxID=497108 RepID=UPI002223FE89|nr:uncharacterized protein KGF54_001091 [Candida jiufengensis]KAI5956616.1 hypothetical protein KGF54_001091 [Candida jiufengensis]